MKNWKGILGKLVYMAAAAGIGFVGGLVLAQQADLGAGGAAEVFRLFWMFAAAVLAAVVQIIVHEAGHLAGGLATGYTFCSFRVGSWMLQKEQGRLKLRRLSLAGTGGQCLLAPPELKEGRMPCVWYNLGGRTGKPFAGEPGGRCAVGMDHALDAAYLAGAGGGYGAGVCHCKWSADAARRH